MCHRPQAACGFERLKAVSRPPIPFLAGAVQFAMMRAAKRDGKFVADFLPKSALLGKTQVVRVAGLPAADKAGLFGYKAQMLLIPQSLGLRQGKRTFVDARAGLLGRRCSIMFSWRDIVTPC